MDELCVTHSTHCSGMNRQCIGLSSISRARTRHRASRSSLMSVAAAAAAASAALAVSGTSLGPLPLAAYIFFSKLRSLLTGVLKCRRARVVRVVSLERCGSHKRACAPSAYYSSPPPMRVHSRYSHACPGARARAYALASTCTSAPMVDVRELVLSALVDSAPTSSISGSVVPRGSGTPRPSPTARPSRTPGTSRDRSPARVRRTTSS